MAIFSDNDRSKVNEEIVIEDVDEVDDDADSKDQDDSTDDAGNDDSKDKKTEDAKDQDDSKGKKADAEDEEKTADYWKKKFSDSTSENQIERERRKKAEQVVEELTKPKEITDDLMKQKYSDWDSYDDAVKATLKNQVKIEQELTELKKSQSEYHNERRWEGQVNSFLDENAETEKYSIADRDAFKKFVNKPERKGMNLDVLAGAFLFEVGPTAKPEKKKGSMLEAGSGQGATNKHKTDKKEYTAEDAKVLRENNPREYERLVRSGKLDIKI